MWLRAGGHIVKANGWGESANEWYTTVTVLKLILFFFCVDQVTTNRKHNWVKTNQSNY